MLDKLIKQDFLRDYFKMLCIYAIVIIGTITLKIYGHFLNLIGDFNGTIEIFFFVLMLTMIVLTISFSIESFRKSMIKDEGYLTHTLPVKTSSLLLSKMLTSYIWGFFSLVLYIGCQCFIDGNAGFLSDFSISEIFKGFKIYSSNGAAPNDIMATIFTLFIVFSPFMLYSLVYFCFAIENLFNKNKELIVFLSIITIIAIIVVYLYIAVNQTIEIDNYDVTTVANLDDMIKKLYRALLGYFVWIPLLASVGLYIASNMIFTKKLNLQ